MTFGEAIRTEEAIAAALREQRGALLRGDAAGLEATLARIAPLIAAAAALEGRLRAASGGLAEGLAGADRDALRRAAAEVRALARANARLLVRARDLTGELIAALEDGPAALDREA